MKYKYSSLGMIMSNLRIAIRRIQKDKAFAVLNVLSLSLGLAAVCVIVTYLSYELSFDQFHQKKQQVYRLTEAYDDDARFMHSAKTHGPMEEVITDRLPGLESVTRILPYSGYLKASLSGKYRENELVFADSTFFRIFSFSFLEDNDNPFQSPYSIVLTETAAQKYFGRTDVVGEPIQYEDERGKYTYHVTAVLEDIPQHSHFHFSAVLNMASLIEVMPWYNNWHHPPMYIYFEMDRPVNPSVLSDQVQTLANTHQPEEVRAEHRKYSAQPLTSIHLSSSLYDEWEANSDMGYVRLFAGVCFFLLLVACINFVNLSTAQSVRRAREIAVRKVMGAFRYQVGSQFMLETFLVTFISLLLALGLAEVMMMTVFTSILETELSLTFLFQGWRSGGLVVLLLVVTFLSGIYPALFISGFKPTLTLKGRIDEPGSILGFRRGLVLFQFVVTGFLIMGTSVVVRQTDLLRNKNLGFDKESLVAIRMVDQYANQNYSSLKAELLADHSILTAAVSSEIPGGNSFHGFEVNPEGGDETISMKTLGMDEDFFSTYGLTLVSGRNFSVDIATDEEHAVILNESAAKFLSWTPEEAVGKEFELILYVDKRVARKSKVIGVVRDFHFESLYHRIEPLVLYQNKHPYYTDYLTVKVKAGELTGAMAAIEARWKKFRPEKPLEYQFLDDRLEKMYAGEMKISSILGGFSILSIFISSLGLFGLASYSAQRKTKEIGIRKVLGANISQLIALLGREYLYLVTIANLLAWPIALFLCNEWIQHFPYQVTFGADIMVFTMMFTLVIALGTIGIQCMKAAMANPVDALKTE